jgi:very-short-patch-repair endonuclease
MIQLNFFYERNNEHNSFYNDCFWLHISKKKLEMGNWRMAVAIQGYFIDFYIASI